MTNIVLATDGSAFSDAAARFIAEGKLLQSGFTVHVVHVAPEVSGQVRAFVSKETIDDWHKEASDKAMAGVSEILSAAESPGFDPNRFRRTPYSSTRSSAFLDAMEPGSAMKAFLVAGALDRGAISAHELIDTEGGRIRVADQPHEAAHLTLDSGP